MIELLLCRVENTVGVVHYATLQNDICLEDRLDSNQVVQHDARITIMGATVESIVHTVEPF